MLVLSRKKNEKVVIPLTKAVLQQLLEMPGDVEVVITTVDIRSNKVRIGLDMPVVVPAYRPEVHDKHDPRFIPMAPARVSR